MIAMAYLEFWVRLHSLLGSNVFFCEFASPVSLVQSLRI